MTFSNIDSMTLEELENNYWKPLDNYPSSIVKEVYSLRKKRISDLDVNDIRLMIGQDVGLKYLMPIAIKILENDILEEGLYYPGDLLSAVLNVKQDYWKTNPVDKEKFDLKVRSSVDLIRNTETIDEEIRMDLLKGINGYLDKESK